MQINTKTEYTISLNHEEMLNLKYIIELARDCAGEYFTEEMEELALDILENIK
jgi:hypothetical protein